MPLSGAVQRPGELLPLRRLLRAYKPPVRFLIRLALLRHPLDHDALQLPALFVPGMYPFGHDGILLPALALR